MTTQENWKELCDLSDAHYSSLIENGADSGITKTLKKSFDVSLRKYKEGCAGDRSRVRIKNSQI